MELKSKCITKYNFGDLNKKNGYMLHIHPSAEEMMDGESVEQLWFVCGDKMYLISEQTCGFKIA
jgi:hypothetical protein